jgi:hypothetical protein
MRSHLHITGMLLLALALVGLGVHVAGAEQSAPVPDYGDVTPVPFGPGEQAVYQVKLGGVSVGSGRMEVLGMEMVNGKQTYHTTLSVSGGIPLARVNDRFDSWIDVQGLFSRRFKQDQKEIRFERRRTYDFFPEDRTFRRENGETGTIPTSTPLDDVSFLFYARTLPLRVGDTYTIPRYFQADGNPVVIEVVRKQVVTVPAGRFQTIVVRPVIKTKGLFGEGGEAEVFFSDDDRRIMVHLRSKVPVIGSLTMQLRSYREGQALAAWSPPN